MKLSVVIPCFNERATLIDLLRAVRAGPVKNLGIILVDDASTDVTGASSPIPIFMNAANAWTCLRPRSTVSRADNNVDADLTIGFIGSAKVSLETLVHSYRASRVCVLLSDYEAFSLPILDAPLCEWPCWPEQVARMSVCPRRTRIGLFPSATTCPRSRLNR